MSKIIDQYLALNTHIQITTVPLLFIGGISLYQKNFKKNENVENIVL